MEVTGSCTITFRNVELTTKNADDIAIALAPLLAQEIKNCLTATPTRGCSVSGSVTHGPGGTSGNVGITCSF